MIFDSFEYLFVFVVVIVVETNQRILIVIFWVFNN